MKSVLKEVISMSLIAIAMVIILILVFYDYLNINTDDSEKIEYSRDAEVANALDDDATQTNQVIVSLSKSMYSLNSDDVSEYVSEGIIDKSKKHPFSDIHSNTYGVGGIPENDDKTTSSSSSSTSASNRDDDYNSGSSNNKNNSNNSSNSSSSNSSTSQKDDEDKEEKEDNDEPFFDKGTTK